VLQLLSLNKPCINSEATTVIDLAFKATLSCCQDDGGGDWTFTAGNIYNGNK
jgi:hypothetical protein